jgi:putative ABC transport system permease protein
LLSPRVARDLGVELGDEMVLERPQSATLTVVGIGQRRARLDEPLFVLGPGTPWTSWNQNEGPVELIDLGPHPTDHEIGAASAQLIGRGYSIGADPLQHPNPDGAAQAVRWSWVIGAVVLTVIGIVIAAAFAAGARRQLTTLGQLAANGASPRVLRRVLFLQGTWTGLIGAIGGLVLGVGALALLRPHIDRIFQRDVGPWVVHGADLVPVVLLGVVAATIAALVPARSTSRVPVLAALAGRRPLGAVPRWLLGAGLVTIVAGLALLGLAVLGANTPSDNSQVWAVTAMFGGVAVLLGACAIAPGFVSLLEPAAGRLRSSWRLAARSLARQRTRTSAVVSAVCATCALAIGASALILSGNADASDDVPWIRDDLVVVQTTTFTPPPVKVMENATERAGAEGTIVTGAPDPALVDAILAELPGTHATTLLQVDPSALAQGWKVEGVKEDGTPTEGPLEFNQRGGGGIGVADDALLATYRLADESKQALESTGALLIGREDGRATISLPQPDGSTRQFDARVTADDAGLGSLPRLIVTPERARELGFTTAPGTVVIEVPDMTRDQREAVQDVVDEFTEDQQLPRQVTAGEVEHWTSADFSWPNDDIDPHLLEAILGGVALVFALFVVGVSLALAAAETRDERDVLDVVGASPAVIRRTSGRKAVLLTLLGVALAIPVGFLPVIVFAGARDPNLPIMFPVRTVAVLAIVVPVVIGAVTMFGSAVALRLRPVRVSTMTFE